MTLRLKSPFAWVHSNMFPRQSQRLTVHEVSQRHDFQELYLTRVRMNLEDIKSKVKVESESFYELSIVISLVDRHLFILTILNSCSFYVLCNTND